MIELLNKPIRLMLIFLVLAMAMTGLAWISAAFPEPQLRLLATFDLLLLLPVLLFTVRNQIQNVRTRALLQLAFILLGAMMILVSLLGMFDGSVLTFFIFLFGMLLPGAALINLGIHLSSKNEEKLAHEAE